MIELKNGSVILKITPATESVEHCVKISAQEFCGELYFSKELSIEHVAYVVLKMFILK